MSATYGQPTTRPTTGGQALGQQSLNESSGGDATRALNRFSQTDEAWQRRRKPRPSGGRLRREDVTRPAGDDPGRGPHRAYVLRRRLLEALLFRGPKRRTQLSEALETSVPILAKEIEHLAAAGIVSQSVENRHQRPLGTRGRPPVYVSIFPGAAHAIGVEIGSRVLRVVVSDLAGEIVSSRTVAWYPVDATITMDRAGQLIDEALTEADVARDRIVGIGVTSARVIAPDSGRVQAVRQLERGRPGRGAQGSIRRPGDRRARRDRGRAGRTSLRRRRGNLRSVLRPALGRVRSGHDPRGRAL